MKTAMLLLCGALALGACNKVTYVNPSTPASGRVVEETGHYFIGGLVGHKDVHANVACPEGVSKVQSKFTFGDLFLNAITIGLYAPRTYEVHCGAGGAQ